MIQLMLTFILDLCLTKTKSDLSPFTTELEMGKTKGKIGLGQKMIEKRQPMKERTH